jgi:hypothetical protein
LSGGPEEKQKKNLRMNGSWPKFKPWEPIVANRKKTEHHSLVLKLPFRRPNNVGSTYVQQNPQLNVSHFNFSPLHIHFLWSQLNYPGSSTYDFPWISV